MDSDSGISGFSNLCRLFPLPDLVFFPHALLPLHIFEPRYRELTTDALADDHLLAMVQILPAREGSPWVEPVPISNVGCLGRIVQHERLAGGRFNLLLLGRHRVRLKKEKPTDKLYRIAEAEILPDQEPDGPLQPKCRELIALFRNVFEKYQGNNRDLGKLLEHAPPLGVLTDIIAHALPLPPELKQTLLEEARVTRRVETLRLILQQLVAHEEEPREFPPRFSDN
jgi:Lon protease-like protein